MSPGRSAIQLLDRRQRADGALGDNAGPAPQRQAGSRHDVRRRVGLAQALAGTDDLDDPQLALAAAGVGQLERVSGLRLREQIAVDRDRRIVDVGLVHARDEAHARRFGHASDRVADRPPLRDRGPGLDRPGAQLGSGEIEGHRAAHAGLALGPAQVPDHALPDLRMVVGAVDAHDLHAGLHQVADQHRLLGGLARHRHHDARPAAAARGTEDGVGVLGEQGIAGIEHDRRRPRDLVGDRLMAEREEHLEDRLQRCHDVRFHAAQRAQPQLAELVLQFAHVVPADGEVVDQVVGALAHRRRRRFDLGGEFLLGGQRRAAKLVDAAGDAVEAQGAGDLAVGTSLGGHRRKARSAAAGGPVEGAGRHRGEGAAGHGSPPHSERPGYCRRVAAVCQLRVRLGGGIRAP